MARRIEKQMQHIFIKHLSIRRITPIQIIEWSEIMREDINASGIDKTRILLHHQVDTLDGLALVTDKLVDKQNNILNIRESLI